MSRKSMSGGVVAKGRDRIQFDFMLDGVRYRPTLARTPTEANLRRARERLKAIKERIRSGTFSFAEEFPDFQNLHRVPGVSRVRTCSEVFDEFLAHCEARVARSDLAAATLTSYRKALNLIWRPRIGTTCASRCWPGSRMRYTTRHSSVSWNLMAGKKPLWTARQHGHSVETMWRVYSAWMDGAVEGDIEIVRQAMQADALASREWRIIVPQ